jgi:pectinesterase
MRCSLLTACVFLGLAIFARAEEPKILVYLVGDSTVQSGSGWGDAFKPLLKAGVECVNLGKGGRSSKSYRAEGWWDKVIAARPTYILIQFGHNDQPGKGPERETDPATTFPENMGRYVDEAIAAGAQPILVTSLCRRTFGSDGKLQDSLQPYAEATKRVAAEKKVPVVDLHARSMEQVEKMGPNGTGELDAAGKDNKPDKTHLSESGSKLVAPLVAGELRRIHADLAKYLKDE